MGLDIHVLCSDGSPLGVTEQTIYGDSFRVGVGGSELALLTMCKAWHDDGHSVILYNNPWKYGESSFEQRPVASFDPNEKRDFLIVFRSPNPRIIPAKGRKIWWSCDQYTVGDYAHFADYVDKIVCISPFHCEYFAQVYGITKAVVIDLPVRDEITFSNEDRIPNRLIFTSVPDRGLQNLWRVYPKLKQYIPDLSLTITSDYRLWGAGELNQSHRAKWVVRDNINFLGAIPRSQYISELAKADLMIYPGNYDELFCVYGDNLIRVEGGVKKASDVSEGDFVVTRLGSYSKVLKKYTWASSNIKTSLYGLGWGVPTTVTENHKVLAIKKRCCNKEPINKRFKILSDSCSPKWVRAGDLEVGDILLSSYSTKETDKDFICLSDYVSNAQTKDGKLFQLHKHERGGITRKDTHLLSNKIHINKSFMRLLGFYLSEGSTSRGMIQFALNTKELLSYGQEIKDDIEEIFGLSMREKIRGNGVGIWACSTVLARFFESFCGKGSRNKHLPEWVMELPIDKQRQLLISLIKGDGSLIKRKNSASLTMIYTSASSSLIWQVRDLFARQGITSSVSYRKASDTYQLTCHGDQIISLARELGHKSIEFVPSRKSCKRMWIHDGLIHMPITKIESVRSEEFVYDFTVEDDPSFMANGRIIHNCISVAEAQMAGVVCITSAAGALKTTNMGHIFYIDSNNPHNDHVFVDRAMQVLSNRTELEISRSLISQIARERFSLDRIKFLWNRHIFEDEQ